VLHGLETALRLVLYPSTRAAMNDFRLNAQFAQSHDYVSGCIHRAV
jgi:hypothetical protein